MLMNNQSCKLILTNMSNSTKNLPTHTLPPPPQAAQADTPRLGRHPLGRYPTWQTRPLGRQPPGRHPPQSDGHCSERYASYWNAFLFLSGFAFLVKKFFLNIGGHRYFLWDHCYPCFGLLVLDFKARVDLSLACFVTCMQWIIQIHLWCNAC